MSEILDANGLPLPTPEPAEYREHRILAVEDPNWKGDLSVPPVWFFIREVKVVNQVPVAVADSPSEFFAPTISTLIKQYELFGSAFSKPPIWGNERFPAVVTQSDLQEIAASRNSDNSTQGGDVSTGSETSTSENGVETGDLS